MRGGNGAGAWELRVLRSGALRCGWCSWSVSYCERKKRRPPRWHGDGLQRKIIMARLPWLASEVKRKGDSVKYDLAELRKISDIPAKEAVPVIQALYPKFDKTMWSKVNSGSYGADLPEDARKALWERFAPEALEARRRSRHGKHRLTCCIRARLEDDAYTALQRCIREEGHATVQDWLTEKVIQHLKEEGYL